MPAMPRWMWSMLLTLLLAVQGVAGAQALKPVPPLSARVTDEAGMLTPDQRQRLENQLADYEKRTGSQIAVLLVKSTEPEAVEQYSIRVTDAWKLGRKGVDDGVLLLVARDNPKALRRLRIEAGRGVQGVLTDAQSKRILQDTIAPYFRQNDYYGGLSAGVAAIAGLLNQEKFPAPKAGTPASQAGAAQDDSGPGLIMSIFLLVIGVVIIRSVFRRRPTITRAGPGGWHSGWGSGTTGFIIGNAIANAAAEAGRRRGGGFGGGGFSGGDGGGFSGGGGSFDGGGASGDW